MPIHTTPPCNYDRAYCESVHVVCSERMAHMEEDVKDVRGAVFGSPDAPGLIHLMNRKLSVSTLRWFLAVFALPAILAAFALYQFYVQAPLTFAEKKELNLIDDRVIKIEQIVNRLPDMDQMKTIVKDATKEALREQKGP